MRVCWVNPQLTEGSDAEGRDTVVRSKVRHLLKIDEGIKPYDSMSWQKSMPQTGAHNCQLGVER